MKLTDFVPFVCDAQGQRLALTPAPGTSDTFNGEQGLQVKICHQPRAHFTQVQVQAFCPSGVTLTQIGLQATLSQADWRMLAVPFDNDKWAAFVDYPLSDAPESYGFTVLHPATQVTGLVVGAIDYTLWKSAIKVVDHMRSSIQIYSGAASEATRDLAGMHGAVSGQTVSSARFVIGAFDDYQVGLAAFGDVLAQVTPALSWTQAAPVGYNTWAAFMGKVSAEKFLQAADFLATRHAFHDQNGEQWLNLDAKWQKFAPKMPTFKARLAQNHQRFGAYLSPFIVGDELTAYVSGTDDEYRYQDIVLRDAQHQILPPIDGLYSLDVTHPGTIAHIHYELARLLKWGVDYLKLDFLAHGSRQGVFYDPQITTGMQAYHAAMTRILAQLTPHHVFISLSIAPILPGGFGHARRVSCDAFGSIDQSEYVNNSQTYLWWLKNRQYAFNDPDHLVLYRAHDMMSSTPAAARTRFCTGLISGLNLLSDDFSQPQAQKRIDAIINHPEIMALMRQNLMFLPLSQAYVGREAADIFDATTPQAVYVICFNYSISESKMIHLPLKKMGVADSQIMTELWTTQVLSTTAAIALKPQTTEIFRIERMPNDN